MAVESSAADIDLYEVLGITRSATKVEVKKAYHKAALTSHPDKVSEDERAAAEIKFKGISKAYEILSDDDKRDLYDAHGLSAFEAGHQGGMGAEVDLDDILAQMFGMGGGMNGPGARSSGSRRPRKGGDEEHSYTVTLEELYKGKSTKFASKKNVICSSCKGRGGKDKAKPSECRSCQGRGVQQGLKSVGPGLVSQETVVCSSCRGTGTTYKEKDRCKRCKGERIVEQKKVLELYIPRGSKEGDKIVLEGEADQLPGQEPGSIIFNLKETQHATFRRAGPNLSADVHVNLAEALCGFSRVLVEHLDGRGIRIQHPQRGSREPLRPGSVIKIPGDGMPHKRSELRGDLFLIFTIDFPDMTWLMKEHRVEKLKELLPKASNPLQMEMVDDVGYQENATLDEFGGASEGDQWEDEEDEDSTQPQCAQQ
ncbi:MAG: hypothetical protein Q9222_001287 [Ikaeria aurantiellina]